MTDTKPGTDMVFATASLKDRMDWSRAIAGAGNLVPAGFRDGPNANPAKILLAVEYGAMLGLHPMAALSGIHVIDGKPTLSAALMSALVHKAGHKLRISSTGSVTGEGAKMAGDFTVTVTLIRSDDRDHPFTVTWNIDRAKRAGLWGRGNWVKYPETQMTWRGVSEVTKLGAPEVLSGVWHTPDELGATVDEDGDVMDAELVEQDHDGPNVQNLMRDPKTEQQGTKVSSGVADETRVAAASDRQTTPAQRSRPGGSRPASQTAAGSAEPTRTHAEVFTEWAGIVRDATDMDALIRAHEDAANRGVLGITVDGREIEDVFLARREELQQQTAGEPEPAPATDYSDDTPF